MAHVRTERIAPNVSGILLDTLRDGLAEPMPNSLRPLNRPEKHILGLAVAAMNGAANDTVLQLHGHMATYLGLPRPKPKGPGYISVRRVKPDPSLVEDYLNKRGMTLAGMIGLASAVSGVRGDHSRALNAEQRHIGLLATRSHMPAVTEQAKVLIGRRPPADTYLSEAVYSVVVGKARNDNLRRHSGAAAFAVGLFGAYYDHYLEIPRAPNVDPPPIFRAVYQARRGAYASVRQELEQNVEYAAADVRGRQALVASGLYSQLAVRLGELLSPSAKLPI